MFDTLIDLYKKNMKWTNDNIGEDYILVNRDGFDLIIYKKNTPEHGYNLVNCYKGHDCYSYNSVSTHIYHILDGEGSFEIDGKIINVQAGDTVSIEPKKTFYYQGKMLLMFEMIPGFQPENNILVKKVTYE